MMPNGSTNISQRKINIAYILGVITIIVGVISIIGVIINRRLIDAEALTNFRYMRQLTLADVWTGETVPGHFVTYRPVTGSVLRLEYLIFGLNPPVFIAINLVFLGLLAILIFEIIFRKTKELLPALVAALFFITDWRLSPNVEVIGEVQITLAAIFGLSSLWLIWFGKGKFRPVIVFLLLLLSTLSKEFGLAFSLAVLMDAVINRRPDWKLYAGIAIGVVIVFIGIRIGLQTMPIPANEYSSILNRLKWYVVNIGSGFLFTFVNLFRPESDGELPNIDNLRYQSEEVVQIIVLQIIPIIMVFILGFKSKENRRFTIPLLFAIFGNSFLFFLKYAFRFHFIANVSMYIISGFGLNYLIKKWRSNSSRLNNLIIVFMIASALLVWRGTDFNQHLKQRVADSNSSICEENIDLSESEVALCISYRSLCIPSNKYYQQENFSGYYSSTDPKTVEIVIDYYDLPKQKCTCLDPYPTCSP